MHTQTCPCLTQPNSIYLCSDTEPNSISLASTSYLYSSVYAYGFYVRDEVRKYLGISQRSKYRGAVATAARDWLYKCSN
jgi:hypothetical protein